VVFGEVRRTSKFEEVQTEKEPKKLVFELWNVEHDSNDSIESNEEVEQPNPVVRRSERLRKSVERYNPPNFHSAFVLSVIDEEPKSVIEVADLIESKLWKDTMVKEMEYVYNNEMWDLVEIPNGSKHFGRKWVFKKKLNTTCQVDKFKARLVAKGYSQVKGVDFGEIFPY
jgi:hypothetical protein